MKKITLTLLLICIGFLGFAQDNEEEVTEYNKIKLEIERNPKKSLVLIKNYDLKFNSIKSDAFLNNLYGQYYTLSNELRKVDSCFKISKEYFLKIGDNKGAFICDMNLATLAQEEGQLKKALRIYLSAEDNVFVSDNILNKAINQNNIGGVFLTIREYDKALYYYNKSLKNFILSEDLDGQGLVLAKMGSIYFFRDEYNKSEEYYLKASLIYKKDNNLLGLADIKFARAELNFNLNNLNKSFELYNESIILYNEINAFCDAVFPELGIALIFFKKGKYIEAKNSQEDNIKKLKKCSLFYALPDAYDLLIKTEAKLGNYKLAYQYQLEQITINDSIYNLEKIQAINDIDTKYQTAEKDKALLQNQVDLLSKSKKIDKQNKQFWIIASVLIGALLILVVSLYFYKKQKQLNKKLSDLNNFKSQIFTIIGHDLRSPIASIATTAKSENTKQKTNTALEILDNLLAWGNLNDKAINHIKEQVFLGVIVDELTDEFSNIITNKQLVINQNFENCSSINANKNEITTVLRNLLNNAIKYNTTNGNIQITCSKKEFVIENTYSNSIQSGTKIGLDIVTKLCKNNNAVFEFNKAKLATSKITFND